MGRAVLENDALLVLFFVALWLRGCIDGVVSSSELESTAFKSMLESESRWEREREREFDIEDEDKDLEADLPEGEVEFNDCPTSDSVSNASRSMFEPVSEKDRRLCGAMMDGCDTWEGCQETWWWMAYRTDAVGRKSVQRRTCWILLVRHGTRRSAI